MTNFNFDRRSFVVGAAGGLSYALTTPAMANVASPKPLNFLVVGDWGRKGGDYQRNVAMQMAVEACKTDAQFVVSTGDNFYTFGVFGKTDNHWDKSFERIYDNEYLQKKWLPVLGNHDYSGSINAQICRTGKGSWHMPDRWHVVRGAEYHRPEIDLFFIDTVVWSGKEKFPHAWLGSSINRVDQQLQTLWLTEQLLSSTAPLKLVFGHHPIYSVGPHGGKAKLLDLDRLFRRTGVTAYVCGHDHCLYHISSKKMDYICSGGGSEELTDINPLPKCMASNDCPDGVLPEHWPTYSRHIQRAGFASFSVSERDVTFKLIDRSGIQMHGRTLGARPMDPSIDLYENDRKCVDEFAQREAVR